MDLVLSGKSVPCVFSLSDTGIPQIRYGTVNRDDLRIVCDLQSKKF